MENVRAAFREVALGLMEWREPPREPWIEEKPWAGQIRSLNAELKRTQERFRFRPPRKAGDTGVR